MITFVVNLHLGIPSMALAEPFLYPLQKEDKIKLIFEPNNNITERIERAAMEVRKHLERSAFIKWQVVFLVNIAANPQSPFKDSLSGQMLLIRKLFLENKWLNEKPIQSYIIALDLVNEDDAIPDIQKSKIYRDSWELDTTGFIRNKQRFFITEEKINALDNIWKSKVKLGKQEVVNFGFERLSFKMQEIVTNTIGEMYNEIRQLLNPEKIDFQQYTIAKNIDYIDAELVGEIKKEFLKRLENTKNDPSRYNNFSPADTLRSCIAEHLGIFADENEYTFRLLRFPFQWSHTDILQQNLIKLSVLLSLIVEQEDIIKSLATKNYLIKIKLDERQVQQVAYSYMENLYNVQKHIASKLQNPEPIELALLGGSDCSCSETLDKNQPSLLEFGFLRTNGDLPKWKTWNKGIKQNLEAYSRQARRKMQSCIDKNHRENSEPTIVKEADIDTKAEDLKRIKNTLQNEVEHNFLSKAFAYNWEAYEAKQEAHIKPSLFNRPTINELVLTVFVAMLIFLISFVNADLRGKAFDVTALYYAAVIGIGTLLGVISLALAKRKYQASLDKILQNVFENARQLRMDIYNEFERQKKYLKSLCELNTVRKNYETVNNVRQQRNQDNLLLDYHRRQLEEHQAMAQKILYIFKADEQQLHNQFNEDFSKVDVNLPMHENKIYAPNTFVNYKMKESQKNAQIENTTYKIKNKLGNLVDSMVFSHDRIYNKETRL
ncbi:MAG: hypothetical protein ACPG5B_15835 [Chitinophagales bacterium]